MITSLHVTYYVLLLCNLLRGTVQPPAGATAGWNAQRHLNASISVSGTRHGAGIALRGPSGDIWLQLQEGQICRFDGKKTCQLRIPAWQEAEHPGEHQPQSQDASSLPPYLEGSSTQSLLKTCRYLQGSPRFNLWFTAQSALEDPRTHHQMKGEEMNEASFITSSLSIKARPYQRPPALLKTPQTDGQISSDRLIEFWQTAHKEKGDH